jgi:hypothetical protein
MAKVSVARFVAKVIVPKMSDTMEIAIFQRLYISSKLKLPQQIFARIEQEKINLQK